MKKLFCILMASLLVLAVGCQAPQAAPAAAPSGEEQAQAAPAASESSKISEAAKSLEVNTKEATSKLTHEFLKDPSEYKLCVYWPSPDIYFENYIQPGFNQFEKDYGAKVEYVIGTEWTQDVENQMVEAKAADGYDLFWIYGADTSGANALYRELTDFGCKVVNYGGDVDDPQEASMTICGDVYVQAYNSAKRMCEAIGEGKIINVLENLGDVNTLKRQQGVEAAVAEFPNISIAQTIGDITTDDQGYEKVSTALSANPDASGIIATGGTASKGMASALDDYYKTNKDAKHIYCAAMDQSDEVMNGLSSGNIDHTIGQNGYGQGYIPPLALLYLADGWEPATWGQKIDTGFIFIDKDNIDSWQGDIEALTLGIVSELESKWLVKG